MKRQFDTLIIGGGLNGLAAARHLARTTNQSVAVLEQFEVGHYRGSSHGMSRILRSTYPDPDLVHLMQRANEIDWPELENASGKKLVHRTGGCLFGPEGGLFDRYAKSVAETGADVDLLNGKQAAKRFPAFNFNGLNALADHTAGLIDALKTIEALKCLIEANGGQIMENSEVIDMDISSDPILVETAAHQYQSQHLIIASGAWAGRLVPELREHLKVVRQTVGYFSVDKNSASLSQSLPVWAYLGKNEDDVFYGLPEFRRPGIKAAKHLTETEGDNPDDRVDADPGDLEPVKALLKRRFNFQIESLIDCETCLYTLTPSHNFIIDNHPLNPHVAIGAGFSGHGFKFGPLTGRLLAELALKQTTSVDIFNEIRNKFALPV